MSQGIYTATSGAVARQQQLNQVSHNLANLDTVGHRAVTTSFEEVLVEATGAHRHVRPTEQLVDPTPGTLERTGNPLDLALAGPGFFLVQRGEEVALTRAGNFRLTSQGSLVTASGDPVLNTQGSPILIPSDSTEIFIDSRGQIQDQLGFIDDLAVVTVDDPRALRPFGESLFLADGQPTQPLQDFSLEQGFLEKSNVNALQGITDLVALQRHFETMQQLIQTYRSMDNTAISQVGRPPA